MEKKPSKKEILEKLAWLEKNHKEKQEKLLEKERALTMKKMGSAPGKTKDPELDQKEIKQETPPAPSYENEAEPDSKKAEEEKSPEMKDLSPEAENLLKAKEEAAKKTAESSKHKNLLNKSEGWWKNLDKTRKGKALKAGMGALFIASTTIALGSALGIAPSSLPAILYRLGTRTGAAVGINMAVTSDLTKKILMSEKNRMEKTGWKKHIGMGDVFSILGLGGSALLSGGLAIPIIGLGGYLSKKVLNGIFDSKIDKLDKADTEESNNAAKKLRRWKSILNGAATIGVGLGSMAEYHHEHSIETSEKQAHSQNQHDHKEPGENKNDDDRKEIDRQKEEELRKKLEEAYGGNKVEFSSRGAIQTINDLKAKISSEYPDISKAPQNVQDFMKEDSVKQAIKLGFYNPNDPSGAESAMVMKGSSLEFDKEGNLVFHDSGSGKEQVLVDDNVEKYGGKMFDADHSSMAPVPTPAEDMSVPEPEPLPKVEVGSPGLINEYIDTSLQQKGDSVRVFDGEGYKNVPLEKSPDGTVHMQMERLDDWVKTPANIYGLTVEQFEAANNVSNDVVNHFFEGMDKNQIGLIDHALRGDADVLFDKEEKDVSEELRPLWKYMQEIHDVTGIQPMLRSPLNPLGENAEEYISRGLQKAASEGHLDEIDLNKLKEFDLEKKL